MYTLELKASDFKSNRVKSINLIVERVHQLLKTGDPFDKPMLEEFSRNFFEKRNL